MQPKLENELLDTLRGIYYPAGFPLELDEKGDVGKVIQSMEKGEGNIPGKIPIKYGHVDGEMSGRLVELQRVTLLHSLHAREQSIPHQEILGVVKKYSERLEAITTLPDDHNKKENLKLVRSLLFLAQKFENQNGEINHLSHQLGEIQEKGGDAVQEKRINAEIERLVVIVWHTKELLEKIGFHPSIDSLASAARNPPKQK